MSGAPRLETLLEAKRQILGALRIRWIEGYERMTESAADLPPTRHVWVGDRKSNKVELMRPAPDPGFPADWITHTPRMALRVALKHMLEHR
jgi:hypothetical protein